MLGSAFCSPGLVLAPCALTPVEVFSSYLALYTLSEHLPPTGLPSHPVVHLAGPASLPLPGSLGLATAFLPEPSGLVTSSLSCWAGHCRGVHWLFPQSLGMEARSSWGHGLYYS